MGTGRKLKWTVGVLGMLAACDTNHEVLLGRAQRSTEQTGECDAGSCPGDTPDASEPVEAPPSSGPCAVEASGSLQIGVRVDLQDSLCRDQQPCAAIPDQLVPAPDGSVWILTLAVDGPPVSTRRGLGHYAVDGTLLAKLELNSHAQLAVDDLGNAWVLVHRSPVVQRFDGAGQALADISVPPEFITLANYPGQGVALAGHGRITLLGLDGQTLWSQPSEIAHFRKLVANPHGLFQLSATGAWTDDTSEYPVAVDRYDAQGTALFSVPTAGRTGTGDFRNYVETDIDADANLVVALQRYSTPDPGPVVDVESIDATGNTRWRVRLSSALGLAMAALPDGTIAVAAHSTSNTRGVIAFLSQDGASCQRRTYEGAMLDELVVSATGDLWFTTYNGLGRFAPFQL